MGLYVSVSLSLSGNFVILRLFSSKHHSAYTIKKMKKDLLALLNTDLLGDNKKSKIYTLYFVRVREKDIMVRTDVI